MSDILNEVEELRQKAITLLLAERSAIDEKLTMLGYAGVAPKKPRVCGVCGSPEHSARNCPQKSESSSAQ